MSRKGVAVFVVVLLAAAAATVIGIYIGQDAQRPIIITELCKSLIQLAVIGIAGVLAKFLLDRYVDEQRKREQDLLREKLAAEAQQQRAQAEAVAEQQRASAKLEADHQSRVAALAELTRCYWSIKKCLHIISAHLSAKSYGEQVRDIIDHRLALQHLDNDIMAEMYALQNTDQIGPQLVTMDTVLAKVIDEWKASYLSLSEQQKLDEAGRAADRKVPKLIAELPELSRVMTGGFAALHEPFEAVANIIRGQLRDRH